ncbi:MAG: peroxiredoxin [Planctomycetota bacterium]|nr:peroxiredoxin [Planctomycetota bacterium]
MSRGAHDPTVLPAGLPVPTDDGAARHLEGAAVPPITLESTMGAAVNLAEFTRGPAVLFFYPRTGVPGKPPPRASDGTEWDAVPGMRGCTPQSCGYRDLRGEFAALGVRIAGVSTQTSAYQREFAERMHIGYPILSDAELRLTRALRLPSIEMPVETGGPSTLLRRMTWYCEGSVVRKVWYPVFPPDENARRVLEWLRTAGGPAAE